MQSNQSNEIQIQTFRFKFGQEFTEYMSHFAKIHQYDDRKSFKEAWTKWTEEEHINALINDENKHLLNQGYVGDVSDKMFKSARYYYRKKKDTHDIIPRKEYIGLTSTIIEVMDIHIKSQFLENTKKNNENKIITNVSPANAFLDFINTNQSIIQDESVILSKKENNSYFDEKIKKTYKNRYFIQSKNIQSK